MGEPEYCNCRALLPGHSCQPAERRCTFCNQDEIDHKAGGYQPPLIIKRPARKEA